MLILGLLLVWFFTLSDKTWGDIFVNVITDIIFAIFVVFFIEHVNKRDREQSNRSRRRAVALAVQRFYQTVSTIISALIADGVASSEVSSLPTPGALRKKAKELHGETLVHGEITEEPAPYAAFFLCASTGLRQANVFPARTTSAFVSQQANELDQLYRDVLYLDNGLLPDKIVDSLTELKNLPLIAFCRVMSIQPSRYGYWPEDELNTAIFHLGVIQSDFAPILGYSPSAIDDIVRNAVLGALNRRTRPQTQN